MKQSVKQVLAKIRPTIRADGGDIRLISVNNKTGVVKVKLTGACSGCPMAQVTLKAGVEKVLKEEIRSVKRVETV